MAERMSVLFDAAKCTACQACSIACKQWNGLPAERTTLASGYQTHQDFTPKTWTYIAFKEAWENNRMAWLFRKEQCMHCGQAACEKACNHQAIAHTEQGFVVIDQERCIGCGYCVTNCTFHIPRVDPKTNKAYKCTGCPDRVLNGLKPACVQTCQPEALVYGKRADIMALAHQRFAQVKQTHAQAVLYDAPQLDGVNFTYILLRKPEYYGLPASPAVPVSVEVWKDIVRPFGGLAVAGALLATAVGFIKTRGQGNLHDAAGSKDKGVDKHG